MKKSVFILFLFLQMFVFLPVSLYSQSPVVPKISYAISKEDLRKTLEHIVQLSREQQIELDLVNQENQTLKREAENAKLNLSYAKIAQDDAIEKSNVLQREIDVVTADRNRQASEKDKALEERDYWHSKQQDAVKKLWWWRLWCGGGALAIVSLFAVTKFTSWGARNIGPLFIKGATGGLL